MKEIKVLHVIFNLDVAGAQTVVMDYLRQFKNDSTFDTYLLVLGKYRGNVYELECKNNGYKVIYCNYSPLQLIPVIKQIVNFFRLFWLILKSINKIKPDIIHSHITPILQFLLLPYIFTSVRCKFHTLHSDPYAISKSNVLWARIAFHLFKITPICVTENQAIKALKRYKLKHTEIIHNGMDLNKYYVTEAKSSVRNSINLPSSAFVIGCVARLDKIKNFDFLLKVFYEFHQIRKDSFLLLIGEGPERGHIESLINEYDIVDSVKLLGQRRDVERLYKAMDVFILTSFFESSSIVTVEAQLTGIRCVVSDRIPVNVVITSGVNRISLDAPIEKWIQALLGTVETEEIVASKDDYDLSDTISKLKKLYKSKSQV